MSKRVTIPVRVVRHSREDPGEHRQSNLAGPDPVLAWIDRENTAAQTLEDTQKQDDALPAHRRSTVAEPSGASSESVSDAVFTEPHRHGEDELWRDRALRLQAEMENYRGRQKRFAQHEIESNRRRLILSFLHVVDDLERALAVPADGDSGLRRGVQLTHRSALQLLEGEGVQPLEARGQPFDPNWHEAIATTDSRRSGLAPDTVVQVMETGYRLGDQVLRPAKVIVAA